MSDLVDTRDYSKTKVYKIFSESEPHLVYYGSTLAELDCRFKNHNSISNTSTSKLIIAKGDARIELVEAFTQCRNKFERREREAYYILNNPCINHNIPNRTPQESKRVWASKNKEFLKNYAKTYRIENKEKLNKKAREYFKRLYHTLTAEQKKIKNKEMYEKHKEYLNTKKCCSQCNGKYTIMGLQQHLKTAKHINSLTNECHARLNASSAEPNSHFQVIITI